MKFCRHCGKEIADEAVICLSCGCKIQPTVATQQVVFSDKKDSDTLGIVSMCCGIASFFIGWFITGIIAIVLANMSKNEHGGEMTSYAKIGYVCGLVSIILTSTVIVLLIIFYAVLMGGYI